MRDIYKKLLSVIGLTTIVFILIVALFFLFFKANKNIKEFHIEDKTLYTYFGKQKLEYSSHITLTKESDATELKVDGNNVELGSDPLYYSDEKKIILPTNLSAVFPLSNMSQKKVNYYSQIYEENEKVILSRDDKKIDMSHTFLYDGNDLYLFLEDTTITVDGKEINIPAFSYVLCVYNDELYIYGYNQDIEYYDIKNLNDNNIYAKGSSYLVNINYDYIKFNEKSILLTKNIDSLNSVN